MGLPATIRTSIAPEAITKVTRLFNGTVADVLHELLQNARRAGANNIEIETLDLDGRPTLCVRDDGHGIADPAVLVSLGRSGWDETTRHREDPAGMGVFSLAGRHVEIRSCPSGAATGWRIAIPSDAWEASAEIRVEPFPITVGTEIMIDLPEAWTTALDGAAAAAARFYPLPVSLNGKILPREDFLTGAAYVEFWGGCRIAVYRCRATPASTERRINFHGVTLPVALAEVSEAHGPGWSAKVDIVNAPDLQLVLPARKEMVTNDALEALRTACLIAIYRCIADQPEHRLPYENWREARTLGIDMPEAACWLHRWKPSTAMPSGRELGKPVSAEPMIIVPFEDADAEQCAALVLTDIDLLGATPVRDEDRFIGYSWYDRLPRVLYLNFEVEIDGATHEYRPDPLPPELPSGRVPAIRLNLEIATTGTGAATIEERTFPLNVLVCNNDTYWVEEALIFVADGADVTPRHLAHLLEESLFSPDDDVDCDSWETQRDDFGRAARERANRLLLGEDEATVEALREQLCDKVAWLVPQGKVLTATIAERTVSLALADAPTA
ncbi:hypothetical protein CAF53_02445 [Sphingobium sp. LB126]|uniref:ATP-binding protein n=1 Tax=Sphingobium sp. LB126 TaxID=1983755 RepID=UPI000C20A5FD|nr:ATP-binding protein [Sphingobium sp. LB126]PJG47225.1 hypothetical protein CAF53_02445 [Sphingobium sp. LB126]